MFARDGVRDVVDCGPGYDTATVDAVDVVTGCERVIVRQPDPNPLALRHLRLMFEQVYDRHVVAELVEQRSPVGLLEARAGAVADRLNRANVELVALCREVMSDESWVGEGFRSVEHWLTVHVGLSPARAREVVLVARRYDELPAVAGRFDDGRLSLDQASVAARHTPVAHQESVAELAEHTTVPQLRRALSRYVFEVPDPAPGTAGSPDPVERAERPTCVTTQYDPDGRFRFTVDAPADQGALVQQALQEAKDALFATGRTDVTLGDALVEVCQRSLASVGSPQRAARYRVYVHLSADSPSGWVNGGGAIPPSLAALFACDGVVQPVLERDGRPVSVGREQRIVPSRTRRLIEDRDRGCLFPGCGTAGFVEIHHLTPWSEGGRTDFETNICLCPPHHRQLHTGAFTAAGDPTAPPGSPEALTFRSRTGVPIRPPRPPGGLERARPEHRPVEPAAPVYRPPTGEPVDTAWLGLPTDAALAPATAGRGALVAVRSSDDGRDDDVRPPESVPTWPPGPIEWWR